MPLENANDPSEYRKLVGVRIKQIRNALNLTQKEFAFKADLSQSAIAQFEAGERLPSTAALHQISVAFQIGMESLLSENIAGEDKGKELLLDRLVKNARKLTTEQITTINRLVEDLPPSRDKQI